MSNLMRFLCAVMACMLCFCAFAEGDVTYDGIASSSISDTGEIRVYLKSLGDPAALMLTLAGEYAMDNSDAMRFDRGAQLALAADGNDIYLYVGGVTLNMGPEFTLTRCAADDGAENGIYIYESEKNALYEGDLTVRCADGRLYSMLTIGMENYLCGVVAYEMSDSFPLEALKAQAVAARTYAMSKKVSRAGSEYDVTDTTSDQVFKGFIGDYTNVIRAVRETAGVVGTYNGGYATCYYTASNGGQVATPNQVWGGDGDYGYIEQKDDPYDLENSRSLVNSFALPKAYDGENPLWQTIVSRMAIEGHMQWRADGIVSVEMAEPMFEGSRMYNSIVFGVQASTRDMGLVETEFDGTGPMGWITGHVNTDGKWFAWGMKDWEPVSEIQYVTVSVYEDIKDGLGLGLNSRDYEVASVSDNGDYYSVEMRRFGHGTGMSQRGAQTMAGAHGFSYTEILGFYYPGMALERIAWLDEPLPEMGELPRALITEKMLIPPSEGDLGELGEGEYFARVTLEGEASRLNVRAEPTTESGVVAKLNNGYRLVVVREIDGGWAQVRAARFTGYVKMDYITAE